jgi:hypothetical protein
LAGVHFSGRNHQKPVDIRTTPQWLKLEEQLRGIDTQLTAFGIDPSFAEPVSGLVADTAKYLKETGLDPKKAAKFVQSRWGSLGSNL